MAAAAARSLYSSLSVTASHKGPSLRTWPLARHARQRPFQPAHPSTHPARCLHHAASSPQQANSAAQTTSPDFVSIRNEPLTFPCLDAVESRTSTLAARRSSVSGPEPSYTTGAHKVFHSNHPLLLDWGGLLPTFDVAYETWGSLNSDRSNAILLHTGLSASSHAHSTPENDKPGWWERFIGPGAALDTDKYFVICTNVLGGCYGSTGPSSLDSFGVRYGTRFPILTMEDMVRAQFRLLDHLGIQKLYASVGSSMGGMQSLAVGVCFPSRVGRIATISGCARSHPYSIAMRHTQRQVLMNDPNWSRGFYYDGIPPHAGMKLARQIATITYRSGPEWEERFGRRRADPSKPPALCPDFLIETYLDHAGEKFCLEYDANSWLYISKAMDLFDLGAEQQQLTRQRRKKNDELLNSSERNQSHEFSNTVLPQRPYEETEDKSSSSPPPSGGTPSLDLIAGLEPLAEKPVLVIGVNSDILFPAFQQREVADAITKTGNERVTHISVGGDYGHDTFLLDVTNVGGNLRDFLD